MVDANNRENKEYNTAEKQDINNETFNLTKDTITVKEVAEVCKKYNPKIILKETNDEIPNLGFSLSNKKIFKTGFNFLSLGTISLSIFLASLHWLKAESIKNKDRFKEVGESVINSVTAKESSTKTNSSLTKRTTSFLCLLDMFVIIL